MAKDNVNNDLGDVDLGESANENSQKDGPSGGTPDSGEGQGAKYDAAVAMANAEKGKRQTAEDENITLKAQMAALTANPPVNVAKGEAKSAFEQIAVSLGYDPEYLSPVENGKVVEQMIQLNTVVQSQQSFISSHSDYSDAVGVHTNNGLQMSEPLKRVMKDNPGLSIQINQLDPAVLYQLATSDPQYRQEVKEKAKDSSVVASEKAKKVIEEAAGKVSISNAASSSSADKAQVIANESDEDFAKRIAKIKAEE